MGGKLSSMASEVLSKIVDNNNNKISAITSQKQFDSRTLGEYGRAFCCSAGLRIGTFFAGDSRGLHGGGGYRNATYDCRMLKDSKARIATSGHRFA